MTNLLTGLLLLFTNCIPGKIKNINILIVINMIPYQNLNAFTNDFKTLQILLHLNISSTLLDY